MNEFRDADGHHTKLNDLREMIDHLREAITELVVKHLEHHLERDKPVNVAAISIEMAHSIVDMIMEQEERHQASLLASAITALGNEYLRRHRLICES
jgi:hypothetical protein